MKGLPSEERIAVIGAGKVGKALIRAIREKGFEVVVTVDRDIAAARSCTLYAGAQRAAKTVNAIPEQTTFVIVAVPDDAIEDVASLLAQKNILKSDCVVVHTSGALSSDVLQILRPLGAHVASMHPIQTFVGNQDDWARLSGTYFGLEGDNVAIKRAKVLINRLGGLSVQVPKDGKPLYHLSCAFVSNYLIALAEAATRMLQIVGFKEEESLRLLIPLIRGSVENLAVSGISKALTGPIARGDVGTVRRHLAVLRETLPELRSMYVELGRIVLDVAQKSGNLDVVKGSGIRELLNGQ